MGTSIKVVFNKDDSVTDEAFEAFSAQVAKDFQVTCDDYDMIEIRVTGTYNYCGEFPNVEGFPQLKGVTWQKWYEERDPDESGELGDEE